jgi:topoisomerase-4 subunit A
VKFPLLLAQGVEGIAVGLACKIMPHNFNELIDGSIDILRGKKVALVPDFPTGGLADFSNYNDGLRGGKIRIRAKINQIDKKTLVITEIPFSTTTGSLMESIVSANEKEKIKIRKIEDNTAENVEIILHLHPGISPDKTIDALYAFTNCEVSVSPNACIIENEKPRFVGVNEMLKISTHKTLELLRLELNIRKGEIEEAWHFSSLEKIFIEKRIYRNIEESETWEEVLSAIDKGLKPYKKLFKRAITTDDIARLTEIKIKRISKFDSFKADEHIKNLEEELQLVNHHLEHIVEYAIEYFKNLKKKYGKGRERKTEIKAFEIINATTVAVANEKLYVNREEGFAGYNMKKDEYVCDCSDIDDIIVFRDDGSMSVSKVSDKSFVGKGIIYINVFRKNDERTLYNMIYRDGTKGKSFAKRFAVSGVTRDKIYDLTKGNKGSEVLYFTANANGEAEVVTVIHKPLPGIRKLQFDFDFGGLAIKGRNSQGNTLTNYGIKKVVLKEKGLSTLGARSIWFDDTIQRLNTDGRGTLLGEFSADDKILYITQSGHYRLINFDLSNHFDEDMILIEKFNPEKPVAAVYFDAEKKEYYVKRFLVEVTDKKTLFISEFEGSRLEMATTCLQPQIEIKFQKKKNNEIPDQQLDLKEFIGVKGLKAKGNRLTTNPVKEINNISPPDPEEIKPVPEPIIAELPVDANVEIDYDRLEQLKNIRKNLDNMDTQMTLDLE